MASLKAGIGKSGTRGCTGARGNSGTIGEVEGSRVENLGLPGAAGREGEAGGGLREIDFGGSEALDLTVFTEEDEDEAGGDEETRRARRFDRRGGRTVV